MEFKLHSEYQPTGDQPEAIAELVKGFQEGNQFQTLLGVTGSGKTFTMANIIAALNKPTLIIAHNKTLAGQLYGEMKEFFPENAVEYFVSYYDYYQPEAYVPSTDTYIAKDSAVNEEIDKLRLSATASLTERRDVVVVASVSCIYGLGSPDEYQGMMLSLRPGMQKDREEVIRALIEMQYDRNDMDLERSRFRVHGDIVDINPAQGGEYLIRVEFFGDEIDRISEIDPVTQKTLALLEHVTIFPASHYVVAPEKIAKACDDIEEELKERVKYFKSEDKLLEAQRISERTNFDIETVFTPAYNRAHTLPRTYESLCRQSCKDFVWLIVDDGSSDGTRALVEEWQTRDNGFPIRYIYKENGGMHTAHNTALWEIIPANAPNFIKNILTTSFTTMQKM